MTTPVLVLSDIHGNLEALKAVLQDAAGEFGEIWVLGDIAGYGPDPGACVDMLRRLGAVAVAGNHDLAAADELEISGFNDEARAALSIHRRILKKDQKEYLVNLPKVIQRRSVSLSHGHPADPIWGYVLNDHQAAGILTTTMSSLTLLGHSHIPALWFFDAATGARYLRPDLRQPLDYSGSPHLANPGSVGQSRDGEGRARYMLIHPERKTLEFRDCSWRKGPLKRKMRRRGYPASLIARMACESMPLK